MDSSAWDARYAASELVWSAGPNQWVEQVCADLAPGRALDLAAGEGRNAIWLATRGWQVTASDFSPVAVARINELARARLGDSAGHVDARVADATQGHPGEDATYDLVVISYLQLPDGPWRAALAGALRATAPGGRIVIVLHARRNLEHGYGGPQDPAVVHDPGDVIVAAAQAPGPAVDVERAELVTRRVDTESGMREALDTLVVLRRRPTIGQ